MFLKPFSQNMLLSEQYLNLVYQQAVKNDLQKNTLSETQGEILYPSVDKLLSQIKLTEQDVFVDFGSGLGKIVAQVFLNTDVKEAIGIEILPELHQVASAVAERIYSDLPDFYAGERKLNFKLGSFLEISITTATVALVSAICYPPAVLYALGTIINNTPSIHTVLTLRPIASLERLVFKKTIHIQCSWDSALCYVYQ